MAVFSNNQVRQLYVVTKGAVLSTGTPSTVGEIALKQTPTGDAYILHKGKGGLTRSDLIPYKNIEYIRLTTADEMAHTRKAVLVTLDSSVNGGAPIVGQDYILRILFKQYMSPDEGDQYIKDAAVRATSGMTDKTFYVALAKSLIQNFSREAKQLLTFYLVSPSATTSNGYVKVEKVADAEAVTDATGLLIEEGDEDWVLGTMPLTYVNFEVYAGEVTYNGTDVTWGTINDKATPVASAIPNGKNIADMEYFYHGERGDQYRGHCWPNVIPTEYMVDPTQEYDVLDIHYSYTGANHSVQKSEKDLTIVYPKGISNTPSDGSNPVEVGIQIMQLLDWRGLVKTNDLLTGKSTVAHF